MLRSEKIYYMDDSKWDSSDYEQVNSYFNRLFNYEEKNREEISSIDLSSISRNIKTIMYCILSYYNKLDYFTSKYSNLKDLLNTKPLEEELLITSSSLRFNFKGYKEMGLII